jgi:hypothetical protein
MMELFKDTGTAKIPAINEYIMDMLEGCEEKMLVFCHHQDVMVCSCLTKYTCLLRVLCG